MMILVPPAFIPSKTATTNEDISSNKTCRQRRFLQSSLNRSYPEKRTT